MLQKAFFQHENDENKIAKEEEENEIKQAEPNCEENDEYLNLLLMKEGKPAESFARGSIKKKAEDVSQSVSSCNIAPEVLKQSNKLNVKKSPIALAKFGRVFKQPFFY